MRQLLTELFKKSNYISLQLNKLYKKTNNIENVSFPNHFTAFHYLFHVLTLLISIVEYRVTANLFPPLFSLKSRSSGT